MQQDRSYIDNVQGDILFSEIKQPLKLISCTVDGNTGPGAAAACNPE